MFQEKKREKEEKGKEAIRKGKQQKELHRANLREKQRPQRVRQICARCPICIVACSPSGQLGNATKLRTGEVREVEDQEGGSRTSPSTARGQGRRVVEAHSDSSDSLSSVSSESSSTSSSSVFESESYHSGSFSVEINKMGSELFFA